MTPPELNLDPLRARLKGRVVTPSDGDFDDVAFGGLWNRLHPTRAPEVIARVDDEQDVVEAVRFAKANGLRVVVRGGGHNWCAPSLREGGMMIDLTNLNRVVSIDDEARTAVVQPILSNREVQAALNPRGLSYPSGHCPEVKMSGYLLGGGMAWNQGSWGPGALSVEAVELVTADGELVTADASHNADLFWAARGAGSGLFAVAVRFHLRLQPLPAAMMATDFSYRVERAPAVAEWLGELAPSLSKKIELSVILLKAPAELEAECADGGGKVCLVTATAFADTEEEGRALLPLQECPIPGRLALSPPARTDFEELFDLSGSMWPAGLRCLVDEMFYDEDPGQILGAVGQRFATASEESVILFAIFTGPDVPAPLPDVAFSMSAKVYGGPWTQWADPSDDAANHAWHDDCVDRLVPLSIGTYLSESDTMGHPERAERAFSPSNWERLAELRRKYDPDGVFFGYEGY